MKEKIRELVCLIFGHDNWFYVEESNPSVPIFVCHRCKYNMPKIKTVKTKI